MYKMFFRFIVAFIILINQHYLYAQLQKNVCIYEEAEISLWVPDNWTKEKPEGSLLLISDNELVSVQMKVLNAKNIETALQELEVIIKEQVTSPEIISEPEIIEVNDIFGVALEARGKINEITIGMGVFLMDFDKNILLIFGRGPEKELSMNKENLDKIINSIESIR